MSKVKDPANMALLINKLCELNVNLNIWRMYMRKSYQDNRCMGKLSEHARELPRNVCILR